MSRRIDYTRVSIDDQNPDLQREALARAGCSTIYEEPATRKSSRRLGLDRTKSADGNVASRVCAALAEFDRYPIRARALAGLAAAHARGRAVGRKLELDAQQIFEIRLLTTGLSVPVPEIAGRNKVSRTTSYKVASVGTYTGKS